MTPKDVVQKTLLGEIPSDWKEHWKGMPEYVQVDMTPHRTIYIHFANNEDVRKFAKLVGQKISAETKYLWFPKVEEKLCTVEKEWVDESAIVPPEAPADES